MNRLPPTGDGPFGVALPFCAAEDQFSGDTDMDGELNCFRREPKEGQFFSVTFVRGVTGEFHVTNLMLAHSWMDEAIRHVSLDRYPISGHEFTDTLLPNALSHQPFDRIDCRLSPSKNHRANDKNVEIMNQSIFT